MSSGMVPGLRTSSPSDRADTSAIEPRRVYNTCFNTRQECKAAAGKVPEEVRILQKAPPFL
jgi:hypothetical protein